MGRSVFERAKAHFTILLDTGIRLTRPVETESDGFVCDIFKDPDRREGRDA
jgi:hypothetical protein